MKFGDKRYSRGREEDVLVIGKFGTDYLCSSVPHHENLVLPGEDLLRPSQSHTEDDLRYLDWQGRRLSDGH